MEYIKATHLLLNHGAKLVNNKFMIVFIVSFSFFIIACSNASNDNNKLEVVETTPVSKDNFYEFINEFEYINYHENGNIKEYNYVSPKSGDTLFRFFYDEEGKPKSMDSDKKDSLHMENFIINLIVDIEFMEKILFKGFTEKEKLNIKV